MSVLSVDPGTTCGITLWSDAGDHYWTRELHIDQLKTLLSRGLDNHVSIIDDPVRVAVVEDFRLRRNKAVAQTGSRMDASRALGYVELFAENVGAQLVVQQPDILRITAMHARIKVPAKSHIPDGISSYLHGFYYLEKVGLRKPLTGENTDLVS